MSLPNSSFKRQPDGTGVDVATDTSASKDYASVQLAGPAGHILGTRDSYILICPATGGSVVGANKVHLDLWNGSSLTMEIHGIWCMNDFDVAVTGTVAVRVDVFRSTSVGTGGTSVPYDTATTASRTISPVVPGISLASGISAREAPTGGATTGIFIGQAYTMPEEASTSQGYFTQFQNMIRYAQLEDVADLRIPASQGIKLIQGPVASVGRLGMRIAFTVF